MFHCILIEIPYNQRDPSRTIIPKSNSTTYGLKSPNHEGNRLSVDIKTSESLAIFMRKINGNQGFKYHTIFKCFFIYCILLKYCI